MTDSYGVMIHPIHQVSIEYSAIFSFICFHRFYGIPLLPMIVRHVYFDQLSLMLFYTIGNVSVNRIKLGDWISSNFQMIYSQLRFQFHRPTNFLLERCKLLSSLLVVRNEDTCFGVGNLFAAASLTMLGCSFIFIVGVHDESANFFKYFHTRKTLNI